MSDYDYNIPAHTKDALDRWVEHGLMPGGFLEAVLTNDLFGAVGRADSLNLPAIKDICSYIYNELPSNCWHSPEAIREWQEKKLRKREVTP